MNRMHNKNTKWENMCSKVSPEKKKQNRRPKQPYTDFGFNRGPDLSGAANSFHCKIVTCAREGEEHSTSSL